MAKEPTKKTTTYILKPNAQHNGFKDGMRHLFDGSDPENNEVELTEGQAKAFADKFLSKREVKAREKVREEMEGKEGEKEETIKKPDPTPSVGTNEPTPPDVTPPPTGSTPAPAAQMPASGGGTAPVVKK